MSQVRLHFPANDKKANGKSLSKKRPWLKQGATGSEVNVPRRFGRQNVVCVHFTGSPRKEYDLVSPEFLKTR